jgi:P-type conjugative transfer protein TrbL
MQYMFLNDALDHFLHTIQNVWAATFQIQGIQILLAISAIAFAVYAGQLLATHDVPGFILGFGYTILSLAVLHAVFLYSQELATDVYNGFLQWGQQVSGESPGVLTPSGVMETGLHLARIFWTAGGHASWFFTPFATAEQIICIPVVVGAFAIAAIILLLTEVWVWALIIGASVFLAFAALPWTWSMFPGWALTVLAACIKVFFLLCILAVGLNEAQGWTTAMAGASTSIVDDTSLMMEAIVESILFAGLVYYIPNLMAAMVSGAAAPALNAGEAMIGSMLGSAAGAAGGVAAGSLQPGAIAEAATNAAASAKSMVNKMLLR